MLDETNAHFVNGIVTVIRWGSIASLLALVDMSRGFEILRGDFYWLPAH